MSSFIAALSSEPPPPCVKFDCPQQKFCADDLLACVAFLHYVEVGNVVHPYNVMAAPTKERPKMWMEEQARPTRGIYERVFG